MILIYLIKGPGIDIRQLKNTKVQPKKSPRFVDPACQAALSAVQFSVRATCPAQQEAMVRPQSWYY